MPKYNAMIESFEEVTIFNKPALFTPLRIDRCSIPNGFFLYEIRHDDDCQGDVVQIGRSIIVNHWGSLVTRDEITLPSDGFLDIEPEDINYSAGECRSMRDFIKKYPHNERKINDVIMIVDAPVISLDEHEKAGDVLLKFYRALGWNGEDYLDPCKIRTTKTVFNYMYDAMHEKYPNPVAVGMTMTNSGPGTEDYIPSGKVYLMNGWIKPDETRKGGVADGKELQAV
jgi:hypothetical protein